MRTHSHKSRFSEQQAHIRLGHLMAYLLNSRAVKIWPGWFFLLLGLAVADVSYSQDTEETTESSSLCSANPGTWTVRDGIISKKLTDYTYSGTGADLSKPIGGWDKYYAARIITEKESESSTYKKASNLTQLRDKLRSATAGDTIFVVGTADILITEKLVIPSGVTLASNRGQAISNVSGTHVSDGFALGALLRIDDLHGKHARPNLLIVGGDNVRITGLRLRGPQREVHPWGEGYDTSGIMNASVGKVPRGKTPENPSKGYENLEVDNCELFQWPFNAIYVGHEGTACVRNNYIHHNQRWGLGYGIGLEGEAKVSIEENLFAFNRHCVAGTGYPEQEYTARHNVVLASNNPPFDMHGLIESCPDSRNGSWDCHKTYAKFDYDVTGNSRVGSESGEEHWHFGRSSQLSPKADRPPDNQIGGKKIHITHNTVASVTNEHKPMDLAKRKSLNAGRFGPIAAVYLRGVPWMEAVVEHNSFAHSSRWGGAYEQVSVNTKKKYKLPYNFNKSGNDNTNGVGNVWDHDNKYRRFFERFGDVFQEMEETTIPAAGRFLFSSDKWDYKWSADSGSGYRLKSSVLQTWRVKNGSKKATTKHDLNDPIGEMRSKRFQINKNYVSFRIAGFKYEDVKVRGIPTIRCIEDDSKYANQVAMLRAHDDAVIFKENVPCDDSFVLYDHDLSSYNKNNNDDDTWAYFVLSDGDWHDDGWIEVDDIYFFDGVPTVKPTDLKAKAGDGEVTLQWKEPTVNDPSITGWAYRKKEEHGTWSGWKSIPGGRSTLKHTVPNLDHGNLYSFQVCAVNAAGEGSASDIAKVALINVAYNAASYNVLEGGKPVKITVRLTPAADRTVVIPIQEKSSGAGIAGLAEKDDYILSKNTLSFAADEDSQHFTIKANLDNDGTAEETLILGFGTLPTGVREGKPATTRITIYEDSIKIPPFGLSVESELNNLRIRWNAASGTWGGIGFSKGVTGYKLEYQSTPVGKDAWSNFKLAATTAANIRSYRHSVSLDHLYRYRVQSLKRGGASRWSAVVPAAGATALPGSSPSINSMTVDNQNVTVRWKCPNSKWCDPLGGASVAPLRLQSRMQSGSGAWTDWSGVASSELTTITHPVLTLNQALVHRFQTRVVNANGGPGYGSPSAVVVPLRTRAGDGKVQLGWDAPGRGVDGWQYRFKADSAAWGAWQGVPNNNKITLSHEVSSLTNGVSYQFQVRATYRGKVKVVSFIQSATPVGTLSLTASGGDGQVGLSWTAPANSSTIAGYKVRWRISDSGQDWSSWSAVPGGISARSKTVTGLTNRTTYQFQVQALNNEGSSVAVSKVVSATPRANFSFVPPRVMKTATVGLQFIFNRPNPVNGTGTITYATTSTGSGLTATKTGISGTPTTAGSYDFTWTATDGAKATAIFTLTLTVRLQSSAPSFDDDSVSYSAQAGSTVNETLPEAEGADSYETSGTVPGYVTVNTTTRAISIQPENTHVGDDSFTWRARNTHGTDDLTVNIKVTAVPTVSAPGPVRNLSAEGGSVSGSIAVSWDAPNTGGTPDLYRVEYRQGSAAWQAGGTTTQTSLSIGNLVGSSNYSIQVRAENSGGNSSWRSTTATATNGTQTQHAYRLHTSGTTAPTFSAAAGSVPTNWSLSRPTPNPHERYEWRISRTRPTGGSWSNWGSATVVSTYTERQTAYRLHTSGTTAPTFSSSASSVPTGWSSSRQTPNPHERYEWRISRTRPTGGSWSNWGSATVVRTYTERQTAYRLHTSGTTAPTFSAPASGVPSGWSSSRQSPTSSNRYEWRISRTRPTGGSWSNWGSATVVSTYTERQTAYRLHTSGTTAPTFSSSASSVPTGWSSSRQTPNPHERYEWRISRTRPTGGSWSNWGSATVVSTYTERQTAYRLHTSGTTAPTFSAPASGVPSGWSSSRPTPNPHERYEWRISRTRPTGGSWSNWGSATVVSTYTERQTAYRLHTSGTTAPTFSAPASGVPSGWSSSRQTPTSSNRYEWRISRTRPTGGSWSNWGSATVVSTYTERQTAYRLHTSGTTAPTFSAPASGVPSGWSSSRQSPTSSNRYEWRISRTRPTGGSWSNWGSATVVSTYTERQTAYRLHTSGTTAPTFSTTASGVPSGWSSSRPTPNPHERYEWRISRTRPTGGSWSNWGSATVVSTWTASMGRYRDGLKRLGPLYASDFRPLALVHPAHTVSRRSGAKYCLINPQV